MKELLRVIAVPGHMIADDLAYRNGNRFRFAGRSLVPVKVDESDLENLEKRFSPAEREYPNDQDHRQYLFRAMQKGSLIPCDEFTAQQAKVKFVPRDKPRRDEPSKPPKNVSTSSTKGDNQ